MRDEFFVLRLTTPPLRRIFGEKDYDSVEVWTRRIVHPVLRMICAAVAENLGAGYHTLFELFRKRGQRGVIYTQRAQAIPCECHRHPSLVFPH